MDLLSDFVALSLLPVWCWRRVTELLRAGNPPESVLNLVVAERWAGESRKAPLLKSQADRSIARGRARGLVPLMWSDPAYPPALAAIVDPPPVLWTRGLLTALSGTAVALVGSRAASPYALDVAERLAGDLAGRGVTVVSGLARGVDSAAHRGALAVSGSTIAVLGSGADVIYPPEHEGLSREIERAGLVVSELVPGTPPLPRFFPQRNRIISGFSRAVVVIEAGEKSGSLITARCALEQGRDVLAVPGNVLNGRNRGGHALLRDGAKIVETADDILEELDMPVNPGPAARASNQPEDVVLASLPRGEACDLDVVAERSGLSPGRLLPRLFQLEFQGLVRRVGGGRFVRV